MVKRFRLYSLLSFVLSLSLPVTRVSAQGVDLLDPDSPYANLYTLRPSNYTRTAILWLLGGSGVAAFIYLLWGGLQWITCGGDKDAAEKARKKIMFALTGLAIVFSSYAIIYVIRVLFGVELLEFTVSNLGS